MDFNQVLFDIDFNGRYAAFLIVQSSFRGHAIMHKQI